jgi:hypothetical protein
MQLSEETKKAIEEYEREIKEKNWKNFTPLKEIKKRLKLKLATEKISISKL